jgi:L-ascorbate metabolism protein UlaG (beta-lactamase superfamily)
MRITYIGHATLLIELGGRTILTDPNFDPNLGRFLARVSAPGIALEALPELDTILLTHAHADHLSFRTLERLQRAPLYAPPAVARWIRRRGVPHAIDLAPGESVTTGGLTVYAESATHKGNRYGVDRWRAPANMYLLEARAASVFFAGDTALTPTTTHMVERELEGRRLDVALLPIGYAPGWKQGAFRRGHLTSMDALELFERLGARYLIPYHWGTFNHVTASAYDAIEEMREHVKTHARGSDVHILEPGETLELVAGEAMRISPNAAPLEAAPRTP